MTDEDIQTIANSKKAEYSDAMIAIIAAHGLIPLFTIETRVNAMKELLDMIDDQFILPLLFYFHLINW